MAKQKGTTKKRRTGGLGKKRHRSKVRGKQFGQLCSAIPRKERLLVKSIQYFSRRNSVPA